MMFKVPPEHRRRDDRAMTRLEGFGRFAVLIFAFASLVVLFTGRARAASVGFYAGTFDPPTQAELGILRCALGDAGVRKDCAAIGKTIARVVVSINESSDGDTLASATERALMVKQALQKYRDRVEVVTARTRQEKIRSLLENRNIERLVLFIDSDSYQAVKSAPMSQDPRLQWMVFPVKHPESSAPPLDPKTLPSNVKLAVEIKQRPASSASAVRKVIQSGGSTAGLIDPAVKIVIEKLGLYHESASDLAKLQEAIVRRKLERVY